MDVDKTYLRSSKGGYAEAYRGSQLIPKNLEPQDLAHSNIQYIEECYVPSDSREIICEFPLRIRANSLHPKECDDNEVRQQLMLLAETYKDLNGYQELANRYAKNILLGTWLWRNRECRGISIEVITSEDEVIVIDDATRLWWYGCWDEKSTESLNKLTRYMHRALSDLTQYYYMDIKATLSVGRGDEVYPSQEFLDKRIKGVPAKQLSKACLEDGKETVAFHAQKIGAALQSIDDWWDNEADRPLRVNEYGVDREYVIARRHCSLGNDFYQLVCRTEIWIDEMTQSQSIPNDVHFIMSVLIKGGLFNRSKSSAE